MNLNTSISELTRVGKTTASRLKNLGLETIEDLIFYFPFRYEDYSEIKSIDELMPGEAVTVKCKVQLIANRRSYRKRKMLTEALVADDSGSMKVVWFNQPFISKILKVGDEVFLSGKLDEIRMQMVSPDYEKARTETVHTARIVPIYHLTQGVTQKQMRFLLSQCTKVIEQVEEYLPEEIKLKYKFLNLDHALQNIHFPDSQEKSDQARKRLQFDELFLVQLAIQQVKQQLQSNKALKIKFLEKQTKDFVDSLKFTLTDSQKKCSWEMIKDLERERPMNRLLEGDVGSGKTIVVALAMLNCVLNGYKVVMMAPTEILAEQHFQTLQQVFKKLKFSITLFTGSKRQLAVDKLSKVKMLELLKSGEFDIVVGTHALIQQGVEIKDLGLVIVDEQHRFGVGQRKALVNKKQQEGYVPHFLSMTATPIPRTLVLTLYGDLDLSVITEMPPGRKPIITKVVYEGDRQKAYDFIQEQIIEGRQVFVICPLIDPSDKLGVKSVKQEFEKLDKEVFPALKIGLMHGRLKSKDKQDVMQLFSDKKLDILVSTSVIEVGIDVPNASIMMIEGADRFGLAQLHQFRGRVGRGQHQSYCFLFSDNNSPLTQKRLKYLEDCRDGFKLAEMDLELRGPGEVYGVRQSGLPDLKIASLTDAALIQVAQTEAKELIVKNNLSKSLKKALDKQKLSLHFE
ncbi:ATP-dependent DNA helicase RecG [Candidatus Falkowbacteria bacterium]|jgi:ATP-dependent DNA helicase RecG|nr:ATP-dependent DNA helicase RecG [Candidatus Falkowbacteria bacterium]MBT5503167.1 ATP-dependent DNA helicase RecG [Candidatus Falkowbacteria bacterium]MBT6574555.1 ATP-dependent DNA helicase RecG [Candidatus Falkowbacteria bacterium]MBT7348830.1 ATP-dependent DNA helicase RecG [Candidatus Falkowbacteria bacterium]MBT7500868.1 ATP-dependent DNA helicase RecG [Candidatus Falkowbacteria bacterium]